MRLKSLSPHTGKRVKPRWGNRRRARAPAASGRSIFPTLADSPQCPGRPSPQGACELGTEVSR